MMKLGIVALVTALLTWGALALLIRYPIQQPRVIPHVLDRP